MQLTINATRPSNDLTLRLFELIYENEDNNEAIGLLLQVSETLSASAKLQATALNFKNLIDITHNGSLQYVLAPLDLAILLNKEQYFDLLCDYIFNCKSIGDNDKKIIYTMALMCSIYYDKISLLVKLLEGQPRYLLTEHQGVIQYSNMGSPITLAIKSHKLNALTLLLLHNADPRLPDSFNNHPLQVALALDEIVPKKQIISMIECATELQLAIKGFEANDAALTSKHVSGAIEKDAVFTRSYLKTIAWRAVRQLSNNEDYTDYRFILEFSRIFTTIMRSPLNKNLKYKGEKEFQNDVISHLIGAYDCEQANIPNSVKKLFNTNKEKYEFFQIPITDSLLAGTNLENSLPQMKEKMYLKEDKKETPALVASLITSGILVAKTVANQDELSSTNSIAELKQ